MLWCADRNKELWEFISLLLIIGQRARPPRRHSLFRNAPGGPYWGQLTVIITTEGFRWMQLFERAWGGGILEYQNGGSPRHVSGRPKTPRVKTAAIAGASGGTRPSG